MKDEADGIEHDILKKKNTLVKFNKLHSFIKIICRNKFEKITKWEHSLGNRQ